MKAIVVAGGDAAPEDAVHLSGADLVIAADSGATWLAGLGIRPDLVVGDMDSVDPALLEQLAAEGVTVERHPAEKDESDAELAIGRAVAAGADEVVIIGALGGGRLDHELANLLLLADPAWRGVAISIVRGGISARALHAGGHLALSAADGDLVTLLPLGGDAIGLRTTGLRYPLDGETLRMGRSRGLSNQVVESPASVSLDGGTVLVFQTEQEANR